MKDEEELEMLLGEIPHAVSSNLGNIHHRHHRKHGHGGGDHHHDMPLMTQNSNAAMYDMGMYGDDTVSHNNPTCASPVSGFSLHSDGSSSSLFSGGFSLSDNGSPTTPPAEETKPYSLSGTGSHPNCLQMESNTLYYSAEKKAATENVTDEINLSRNLVGLCISDETMDAQLGLNGRQFFDHSSNGTLRLDVEQHRLRDNYNGAASGMVGLQHQYRRSNLSGSSYLYPLSQADERFPQFNTGNVAVNSHFPLTKGQAGHHYQMAVPGSSMFGTPSRPSVPDAIFYAQRNSANVPTEHDAFGMANMTRPAPVISPLNIENLFPYHQPVATAYNRFPPHVRMPHRSLEVLSREDGLIIQGDSLNYVVKKGYGCPKGNINKGSSHEAGVSAYQEKRSLFDSCAQIARYQESTRSPLTCYSSSLPSRYDSLAEAQGYIYCISKDQHGCRFLQRMFDEGTPQDVKIIFNEIIDHVVELMMNPFGNYLMQKLLDVCNEEQRMEIIFRVTATPGELIRISLNTHGTRVVQKLIETLKSRQQTSLVVSALEPGFLALIKDLNGNHVIQQCLVRLSNEDRKFIFVAAAKYCVDIATHQHGCCVLQRCIEHSTGEHRENLIAEISANGLLLAQDAFGNYVVQFILDHKMPSAATKLLSQFDGNYVNLSTQKFSSHVVEKCLLVCNEEVRSKIIHELLSATHFEQLLQDPHANYVVQTALKVSEGPLHSLLVDVIESHKAISRNSPYSKRIFSHKLLKK